MASSREDRRYHRKCGSDICMMKVQEYGDSLGVHIPAEAAREAGIEKGDEVGVRVREDGCVEVVVGGDD